MADIGTVLLSEVEPRKVRWLWPGFMPLGKLTMLDGDPGIGKSFTAMDIAARVTRGVAFPDGTPGSTEPAGVALLAGEDDLADALLPRLTTAGGDPERVAVRRSVYPRFEPEPPTVADVLELKQTIAKVDARLLIIDPLNEFLPDGANTISDTSMRRALRPIRDLAESMEVAVIVVRHLRKSRNRRMVYAGAGSIGTIGLARAGLMVEANPDNRQERVLLATKSNYGPMPTSLRFRIVDCEGVGRVEWLGESSVRAEDLEDAEREHGRRGPTEVERATEWLREELAGGPRPAEEVKRAAEAEGFSLPTLRRAFKQASGRAAPGGYQGRSMWALPDRDDQEGQEVINSES